MLVVLVLFVSSLFLLFAGYIGSEFFPKSDRGEFLVQIEMPKDAAIEQTNLMTQRAEQYLRSKTEVTDLITTVGQTSEGFGATQATAYKSEIDVKLVPRGDREDDSYVYAAKTKSELAQRAGGRKSKNSAGEHYGYGRYGATIAGGYGSNVGQCDGICQCRHERSYRKIKGATELKLSVETGNPEIDVQVDRDKMAALGLDLQTVGDDDADRFQRQYRQ